MAQKRSSSPWSLQSSSKRALLSENCYDTAIPADSLGVLVEKAVSKQVSLVEELVFKDDECQRLRKKFDEVERECHHWHQFAVNLQTRVEILELILHRQQNSLKNMKSKNVLTSDASAAAQTTGGIHAMVLNSSSLKDKEKSESLTVKDEKFVKSESLHAIKPEQQSDSTGVIDLTDESGGNVAMSNMEKKQHSLLGQHNTGKTVFKPAISVPPYVQTASDEKSTLTEPSSSTMKKQTVAAPYPPLPATPLPTLSVQKIVLLPPFQPLLKIRKSEDGIELSWDHKSAKSFAKIESYELFVYQHNPNSTVMGKWKKIGSEPIKAMPLPMACTLSQFSSASKYYFAVRGKDIHGRYGCFSSPCCSTDINPKESRNAI